MNEPMKKLVLLTILSFISGLANASIFCGPLDENREWFESNVTEQRANESLEKLKSFNKNIAVVDFPVVENSLAVIEARMYIVFINESKEQFGEFDTVLVSQYCSFFARRGLFQTLIYNQLMLATR